MLALEFAQDQAQAGVVGGVELVTLAGIARCGANRSARARCRRGARAVVSAAVVASEPNGGLSSPV